MSSWKGKQCVTSSDSRHRWGGAVRWVAGVKGSLRTSPLMIISGPFSHLPTFICLPPKTQTRTKNPTVYTLGTSQNLYPAECPVQHHNVYPHQQSNKMVERRLSPKWLCLHFTCTSVTQGTRRNQGKVGVLTKVFMAVKYFMLRSLTRCPLHPQRICCEN